MEPYQKTDINLFTRKIEASGLTPVDAIVNKCVVIGREIGVLQKLYNGNNAIIASNKDEICPVKLSLYADRKYL